MFLKNVKIILGVFLVLLVVHSVAYAGPGTEITLGPNIRFQDLLAGDNHSCLSTSFNSTGDFYDMRVRLSFDANVTPDTPGSLRVKIDDIVMPSTTTLDGNNAVVVNLLNLYPAPSHSIKITGYSVDLTPLPLNSLVTGTSDISGTNIIPTTLSNFYGITRNSGNKGSAVLSSDLSLAISPKTYYNSNFYDLGFSRTSQYNFEINYSLAYSNAKAGRPSSNFIYQMSDGYYITSANLSYHDNLYNISAKYDQPSPGVSFSPVNVGSGVSFAPINIGLGIPASDSNASNFAGSTSFAGHILYQANNYHYWILDLSQQYTASQTFSCSQGGTWALNFVSPNSIQNTFTSCKGLYQNTTLDGEFWLWPSNGTWSTNNFRVQGAILGGTQDITYKNVFAVGTQVGNLYTGTLSGMTSGVIVNGSTNISAGYTFANVGFSIAYDPTAMTNTLNVSSGAVYSSCAGTWFTPRIYNWLSDSQWTPNSGTFYINSMNGGPTIGTTFSSGGANNVTSGVNVVETHPNDAALEGVCSTSSTSPTPTNNVFIQSLSFTVSAGAASSVINVTGSLSTTSTPGNASGATVHLTLTGGQTAAVTTDMNGNFSASFIVFSTGDYTVTVTGVDPPSGEGYDQSLNQVSSYMAFVN